LLPLLFPSLSFPSSTSAAATATSSDSNSNSNNGSDDMPAITDVSYLPESQRYNNSVGTQFVKLLDDLDALHAPSSTAALKPVRAFFHTPSFVSFCD
jgi:hypothetical protein